MTDGLSRAWRAIFSAEVLLCLGTVVFWAVAPDDYLVGFYRAPPRSDSHYFLLLQGANVVLCAWVYLYARLLLARPFEARAFRYLQEAMGLGDVLLIAMAFVARPRLQPEPSLFFAQVGMAALWLGIRVTYLWRTR